MLHTHLQMLHLLLLHTQQQAIVVLFRPATTQLKISSVFTTHVAATHTRWPDVHQQVVCRRRQHEI
jgi:hypothetical protein